MALQITFEPRPSIHAAQRPMNSGNGQKVDKLGLGFWASSNLLPASGQFIIPELWPVRYLALAVLLLIEVKIIVAFYRSVFSGASPQDAAKKLQNESGMPAWAAKLAAAEAALWGKVYNMVKALLSSRRR